MRQIEFGNFKLKKTKMISRQILFSFLDISRYVIPVFDKANFYRIPLAKYGQFRDLDKDKFRKEMFRLQKSGFIKKYFENKQLFVELQPKGKNLLKNYLTQDLEITIPKKWDKKWRLVIYDIANDKKDKREILRNKLDTLGFLKLQESVYVFPFECKNEINLIKNMYFLSPYVQYIVADRIETEINLIQTFLNREVLKKEMI